MADSFEEKMACFEKMLEFNPENENVKVAVQMAKDERVNDFFAKANEAANDGNNEQTKEFLAEVFNYNPQHEDAWTLKSNLADSFEEKIACFESWLESDPANERPRQAIRTAKDARVNEFFTKANDAANDGDRGQANEFLAEVFNQNPQHEDGWILKSRMTDSFEEKIACFEKILEFNPENETAQAGVKLRAMLDGGAPKPEEAMSFPNEEIIEQSNAEENQSEEMSQFAEEVSEFLDENQGICGRTNSRRRNRFRFV